MGRRDPMVRKKSWWSDIVFIGNQSHIIFYNCGDFNPQSSASDFASNIPFKNKSSFNNHKNFEILKINYEILLSGIEIWYQYLQSAM